MAMILWARHGQNVANLTDTLSHRVFDGELTGTGRQQAEALAGQVAAVSGTPIGQLICSLLRRSGLPLLGEFSVNMAVNSPDLSQIA